MKNKKRGFIEIAGTRIKLSNIKHYGVTKVSSTDVKEEQSPKPRHIAEQEAANAPPQTLLDVVIGIFNVFWWVKNKKLIITTHQNDRFVFCKHDLGDEFDRVVKELDDTLSA